MSPTLDYRGSEEKNKDQLTPRARHWIYLLIVVAAVIAFALIYAVIAYRQLGTNWAP
jgi:hypothetical protein